MCYSTHISAAGKHRASWIKIGLSVRFAQSLRLNAEPDPLLPIWQREEHRRVFWSVYLLDKLVSCGRNHPPTILDTDCTLRLPSTEENFRAQVSEEVPTLQILHKLPDITPCLNLDHFALMILAASILGRVLRFTLQQQGTYLNFPPWDYRSDYAKMMSLLLSFESLLVTKDDDYQRAVASDFSTASGFDRQRAGHFIWSRGIFQLSHCLLTHPYLMRRSLKPYCDTYPRSYLREASRRCQDSAAQITSILKTVLQTNCCASGSFLAYLAVVASTIHRLYANSKDNLERAAAEVGADTCLDFLENQPVRWEHYPRMASPQLLH